MGYRPLFILSAVIRLLGALAFLWLVARPAARRAARKPGIEALGTQQYQDTCAARRVRLMTVLQTEMKSDDTRNRI